MHGGGHGMATAPMASRRSNSLVMPLVGVEDGFVEVAIRAVVHANRMGDVAEA